MRLFGMFRTKGPNRSFRGKRGFLTIAAVVTMLVGATATFAAHEPPVILTPAAGDAVSTSTVTVTGTAAGDAVLVRLFEGPTVLGETGPTLGHWSVAVPLGDGAHTVTARAQDTGASWSAFSGPVTFTVDTVPPVAPAIVSPPAGAVVPFANVTVEGNAEPGARVSVSISTGGAPMVAAADAAGNWEFTRHFADAPHTLTAVATDAAGNASPPSAAITFRVDTLTPAAPALDTPGHGATVRPHNLLVSGRAEPGAQVAVSEGVVIGTTTASTAGTWSITHTFTEGEHTISARATDAAGHTSAATQMTFTVDTLAPGIPVIAAPAEGAFVPRAFTVRGTAEPDATVQLLFNTAVLAETAATGTGSWTTEMESFSGPKMLQARVRDAAGNIGGLSPLRSFTVDADHPSVTITAPDDGAIFLPTQRPTIRGTARDDLGVLAIELHFFDLLANDVLVRNAVCNACPAGTDVEWSFAHDLPPGRYTVKAWAVDRAGNRSLDARVTYLDL